MNCQLYDLAEELSKEVLTTAAEKSAAAYQRAEAREKREARRVRLNESDWGGDSILDADEAVLAPGSPKKRQRLMPEEEDAALIRQLRLTASLDERLLSGVPSTPSTLSAGAAVDSFVPDCVKDELKGMLSSSERLRALGGDCGLDWVQICRC